MRFAKTENAAVDDTLVKIWGPQDLLEITSDIPMKNESSDHFLKTLIDAGALSKPRNPFAQVDPYEMVIEGQEIPDPRVPQCLLGMKPTPRREYEVDLDQLCKTPEVIRYVENCNTEVVGNFQYLPYELARFVVPENQIGIVKTIETDMTWEDPTTTWPRGDCIYHERFDVNVKWYLKVESFDVGNPVDPYSYRGPLIPPEVQIPGTPFGPLPVWREMRFMWGHYNPVFFVLPPNTLLSLWIEFQVGSCNIPLRSVSGRFTGMLQAQDNMKAFRNVTTGW
jgi:hypothetical protein